MKIELVFQTYSQLHWCIAAKPKLSEGLCVWKSIMKKFEIFYLDQFWPALSLVSTPWYSCVNLFLIWTFEIVNCWIFCIPLIISFSHQFIISTFKTGKRETAPGVTLRLNSALMLRVATDKLNILRSWKEWSINDVNPLLTPD